MLSFVPTFLLLVSGSVSLIFYSYSTSFSAKLLLLFIVFPVIEHKIICIVEVKDRLVLLLILVQILDFFFFLYSEKQQNTVQVNMLPCQQDKIAKIDKKIKSLEHGVTSMSLALKAPTKDVSSSTNGRGGNVRTSSGGSSESSEEIDSLHLKKNLMNIGKRTGLMDFVSPKKKSLRGFQGNG